MSQSLIKMKAFGKELSEIRKISGFSQYQLAKELSMSRSHIFRLESGERNANKDLILKIINILKISDYNKTKLFLLANLEPEIDQTNESFKICFYLALELKNKGLIERAKYLIEVSMNNFKNTTKLHALLANLNLLNSDYEGAIKANNEALDYLEKNSKDEQKNAGISKGEIIHNLGYVYFERALEKNSYRDKSIVQNWLKYEKETKEFIDELKDEILFDLNTAIDKFEIACGLEPENLHIADQLARIYYNKANLSDGDERNTLFNKSILLYEVIISSSNHIINEFKKQEASIFLAMALAKIFKIDEASRLINTIINYKPLYYLGYYAKSCIYSINGKNNQNLLKISYDSLVQTIKLSSDLKEDIKFEVDLYNLRFDDFFKEKFNELEYIQEEQDEDK